MYIYTDIIINKSKINTLKKLNKLCGGIKYATQKFTGELFSRRELRDRPVPSLYCRKSPSKIKHVKAPSDNQKAELQEKFQIFLGLEMIQGNLRP